MQMGKTFATIMGEIETQLEQIEEGLVLIAARESRGDEFLGFVLVYRPTEGDYVTWLWNTSAPSNKTFLHTGHYDMDYEEALMDFESRR
jgi:hypothetical protein